eukprot:XP_019863949.1 PREDICTED: uncharacterized protein LOC109593200 [Amphimedon queenslandica]
MGLVAGQARRVDGAGLARPLSAFVADSKASPVHAICAIGHPERFFRSLEREGLSIRRHIFEDHHPFGPADISPAGDAKVLMTEKDAIKCAGFADARHWYLPVDARLPRAFEEALVRSLAALSDRSGSCKTGSCKKTPDARSGEDRPPPDAANDIPSDIPSDIPEKIRREKSG